MSPTASRLASPPSRLLRRASAWIMCLALALPAAAGGDEETDVLEPVLRVEQILEAPPATGLLVTRVVEESQAEAAGVEVGDVIVTYDGQPSTTLEGLAALKTKAQEAQKERVLLTVVRIGGARRDVSMPPGPIGVQLVPVTQGQPAAALPLATPVTFNTAAISRTPRDDWYAFTLAGGPKVGFERGLLRVEGDRLVMRREVAFDGGEAWGLNHFDVTVTALAKDPTRVVAVRYSMPLSGWVSESAPQDLEDGTREWHTAWRSKAGEDAEGDDESGAEGHLVPAGLPPIPSYFVETLASLMPQALGACFHFRPVEDARGEMMLRACLVVAGQEDLEIDGVTVPTWKVEQRNLGGTVASTHWVDETARVVRSDYGGAVSTVTSRSRALEGLHPELRLQSDR